MIIVGIDVSKETLVDVVINRSTKVKISFSIPNIQEAIEKLLDGFQKKYKRFHVICEATAEYHRTLAQVCLNRNIAMRLLNPITTRQFTRATVRKRKTDQTDAVIIAKLGLQNEGRTVTAQLLEATKSVARTATKIVQIQQQLLLMEKHVATVLAEDPKLAQELKKCREQMQKAAVRLRKYALKNTDEALCKLLCSIPGIGQIIAPVVIAEIGDITQFPSGKALVAFAGLDPKVKQSGRGLHHNTHLTKRGSPYLRKALFIAASVAEQKNPEFKKYYEKKRLEGKFYKEATVAVARKILYRIFAVWKRQTPYVL
jgi:transposase